MRILIHWLLSALIILAGAYLLPGIHVATFTTALVLALVLGIINAFIKPILVVLTLPVTILSLGLFILVLNALFILLAARIVPGFTVDGFWWAFAYGILLSLAGSFVSKME
jgi:putative membrane protein